MLAADDLLAGPRGRGLCMAIAQRLSKDVGPALFQAMAAQSPGNRRALLDAVAATDADPARSWTDPLAFLEPVRETVDSAMYWQAPHPEDQLLTDPEIVAALRPAAEAVVAAPATGWWTAPIDTTQLRYTSRSGPHHPAAPPAVTGAAKRLSAWRASTLAEERDAAANRPADPGAPYSGCWWSTPALASLVSTTPPLPGLGALALVWEEDSAGFERAAIWPVSATAQPRVWEIDRPGAWTELVDRYPLEVTHARRHDWYRTTGWAGAWHIPDWHAVAGRWDAVHLTVAGYLTTATRALPLAAGTSATVLAGWDPGQTWWLTDILSSATDPERWHTPPGGSGRWHRTPPQAGPDQAPH